MSKAKWIASLLIGWGIAAALVLPICHMHFDCGCCWPWAGGASHCDIHTPGAPDCPWCVHWDVAAMSIVPSFLLGALASWRSRSRALWLSSLIGFGVTVAGLVAGGIATSLWNGTAILAGLR